MFKHLVFIDSRVTDYPALVAGLSADTEWALLDEDQDGVVQMQAALADRRDLASIRILAHGRPGALRIGSGELTRESLASHATELAAIGIALGVDGDVQIYGCEVGKGSDGRAFVQALAEACGAAVSASSALVGHADLGGTWRLDVGELHTTPLDNPRWRGLLGMTITPLTHFYDHSAGEWRNDGAFAALRADGSVVTWGLTGYGGNSSAVTTKLDGTIDVTQVASTDRAFAALRADGSVVTWGTSYAGGDSSAVAAALDGTIEVTQVFSTKLAFAALRADGSVVTWGYAGYGGNSSTVATKLDGTIDVTQVFSTEYAFAALRADGSVVTWEDDIYNNHGGNSSSVSAALNGTIDVTQVASTLNAFAALRADGSVVTWGVTTYGGNSSAVATQLDGTIDVTQVFSTNGAFAALRADGSVVTWGASGYGGNSSAVATKLDGTIDVTQVFSTGNAFAALRADGSVVTWGNANEGGDSSAVAAKLDGTIDVRQIFSARHAFAALRADGSVVTWGVNGLGGDSSDVAVKLNGTIDVMQVASTYRAFAALRADGSVVTWGDESQGGSTGSAVAAKLDGTIDVKQVFSTGSAFAALRADGSVVTWGASGYGGGSTAVADQLQDVVGMANAFTNDVFTSTMTGKIITGTPGNDSALTGGTGDDRIYGFDGNDTLNGGAGNDKLDGGAGADTMVGGDGNDLYDVDNMGDVVTETNATLATGGNDTVYSTLSAYTLTDNVENLRLLGTGAANGTGNNLANLLYAGVGDNVLDGGTGIDTVSYAYGVTGTTGVTVSLALTTAQTTGGSGSDTLLSIENLTGSANADRLTGNSGANVLNGGTGNDTLDGGSGIDTLTGGDGSDTYYVRDLGDLVSETNATATGGNDTVYSTLSSYTLGANVENGRLLSTSAANLTGNSLNNVLYAGVGNNVLNGSTGIDTVAYTYGVTGTTGVSVSLALTTAQATGGSGSDTLIAIENLTGSNNNDTLTGNSAANILSGGAGIDTMTGGDGSDIYYVQDVGDLVSETNATASTGGTDTVYSTLSSYTLGTNVENGRILNTGAANLTGNSLANVLYASVGNNALDGGTGTDTVSYAYATAAVQVSLAVTTAQATGGSGYDRLVGIENLTGSAYADTLTGNSGANILSGGAGIDTMTGGDGSDIYHVRDVGDLVIETNASASTGGSDHVHSTLAAYTLGSNIENGRILATTAANLTGNNLNNLLYAGVGNNVLNGSTGIDTVSYAYGVTGTTGVTVSLALTTAQATGGSGSDTLIAIENLTGSNNNDTLTGNSLANVLTGGLGKDLLIGGAGSDLFDFNAWSEIGLTSATRDVINDFAPGVDKIDLSTLDANEGFAGNQAFSAPVVGGTFSGAFANAGDLYFDNVAHVLYGNTDADAAAEFAIQLVGVSALTAADFIL